MGISPAKISSFADKKSMRLPFEDIWRWRQNLQGWASEALPRWHCFTKTHRETPGDGGLNADQVSVGWCSFLTDTKSRSEDIPMATHLLQPFWKQKISRQKAGFQRHWTLFSPTRTHRYEMVWVEIQRSTIVPGASQYWKFELQTQERSILGVGVWKKERRSVFFAVRGISDVLEW